MTSERKRKEYWDACANEDLEKVKEISTIFNDVINWVNSDHDDFTGLHIACENGHERIVEYVINLPEIRVNEGDGTEKNTTLDCLQ